MKLETLQDLYMEQLRDIYNAESQLESTLSEFVDETSHSELRAAMERNVDAARRQREQLDQVFEKMNQKPTGEKCEAMDGIIREARELLQREADADVHDAALITSVQRMKHYLMAGLGSVRTFAEQLDRSEDRDVLQQLLDEEANFDEELTQIAEQVVNPKAADQPRSGAR